MHLLCGKCVLCFVDLTALGKCKIFNQSVNNNFELFSLILAFSNEFLLKKHLTVIGDIISMQYYNYSDIKNLFSHVKEKWFHSYMMEK